MLATVLKWQPRIRQVQGDTPAILSQVLEDDVNLAVWQRQLPAHIEDFGALLLSLNEPLAEAITLEISDENAQPDLQTFASAYADLEGYEGFIADVSWLISAYACLLGAKRVGVRLRVLDKAMCPRFHVDHVPVRLITTYAGIGSQWLREGAIDRSQLGKPQAEPSDALNIRQINCGDVALLKGERWVGNEGQGLVHRSPPLQRDERRLLLTLDWLA
ncbi:MULTISPECIES: DUF1826 domain-containing protein [Pseudomonas]|uniref:DUF1826 domain-containing protein n=1 Tax=Pseudomonas phytophila TaxID=2867264 RepID=A0ABY6FEB1_9PSED|nr:MULTISPECIES: DUF1826 domain-containing protein [Pseudomonas]MCD5975903.1 DUF1826 domain-containing protein [Pseudomonas quasicaspiana]MCD5986822.1 DUF1826 domain-containing protein [Pseudomonas quasicaspiana]MDU8358928.1 DUF1826 domain-containing protein [Pseudomonas syringae group sp. J309-1]UXZ96247.1 DUF1826 domain-containing protein [Pseudomonas phytophila]